MTKPQIHIKAKRVYGQMLAYPDGEAAKHLAKIAGTLTLTKYTLVHAHHMGCDIIWNGKKIVPTT